MGKLTRNQRREIECALRELDMAIGYVMNDRTVIARKSRENMATSLTGGQYRTGVIAETKHYTGRDDAKWSIDWEDRLTPVTKEIGSELVGLWGAKRTLERMLEPESAA